MHVLEPLIYQEAANTNTPNMRTTFYPQNPYSQPISHAQQDAGAETDSAAVEEVVAQEEALEAAEAAPAEGEATPAEGEVAAAEEEPIPYVPDG